MSKMKQWMLASFIIMGLMTSCVEDEQAPFSDESGNNSGLTDVKMPGFGEYYVGDAIVLKGTGFTNSDKVYVRNGSFSASQYEQLDAAGGKADLNGDGVDEDYSANETKVIDVTATELTFVIPAAINSDEATVFYEHGGNTSRLGVLAMRRIETYGGETDENNNPLIRLYGGGFSENDKVYVQNIVYGDEGKQLIGEEREATIKSISEDKTELTAVATGIGEMQVTYERNGERTVLDLVVYGDPYQLIQFPDNNAFNLGEQVRLSGTNFNQGDKIILFKDSESYECETTVDAEGLYFVIPEDMNLSDGPMDVQVCLNDKNMRIWSILIYPNAPTNGSLWLDQVDMDGDIYSFIDNNRDMKVDEIEASGRNNVHYQFSYEGNIVSVKGQNTSTNEEVFRGTYTLNSDGLIETAEEYDPQNKTINYVYNYQTEGNAHYLTSVYATDFDGYRVDYTWENKFMKQIHFSGETMNFVSSGLCGTGNYNIEALLGIHLSEMQQILALLGYAGTSGYLPAQVIESDGTQLEINYQRDSSSGTLAVTNFTYGNTYYTLNWTNY